MRSAHSHRVTLGPTVPYTTWMKGIYRGIASSLFRDSGAASVVYKPEGKLPRQARHPTGIFLSIPLQTLSSLKP